VTFGGLTEYTVHMKVLVMRESLLELIQNISVDEGMLKVETRQMKERTSQAINISISGQNGHCVYGNRYFAILHMSISR
jgi:hypothetical protein